VVTTILMVPIQSRNALKKAKRRCSVLVPSKLWSPRRDPDHLKGVRLFKVKNFHACLRNLVNGAAELELHHGTHFTPRSWVNTSLRAIIMHVRRKDEWWCLCAALFNILDHTKTASRRCWKGTIRVHLSLALVTQQS
jgi:hypothetical protein